jgi:hypothetical protein
MQGTLGFGLSGVSKPMGYGALHFGLQGERSCELFEGAESCVFEAWNSLAKRVGCRSRGVESGVLALRGWVTWSGDSDML